MRSRREKVSAPAWARHLTARADVCSGQLCAKGTRVPVAVILDSLAEGASERELLRSYPSLKPVHVRAAIAYAAHLVREEEVVPLVGRADKARREPSRRAG
ncbi:MAG: DUF433 domain-containing protein [Actinobacteria bacterium]|nr:MAG: DUF433 domain-containing protein [Deltaproteobacteria bacterium]TMA84466.1 MAG: DUF433 domain-containing protein [Deltaproteobacteria bacterium]TML57873.1 MAG: DUF433 domain-containing protein [Actinomycetota bacterium]